MFRRRFQPGEVTIGRLVAAARRRWSDISHRLTWSAGFEAARHNRVHLGAFADRHRGGRCFILGNGPSLAKMDLTPLRDEITFGLNRIYLLFDQLPFRPTYYCAMNDLVLEQFADEIAELAVPKFLNWSMRSRFGPPSEHTLFVRDALGIRDFFGTDPRDAICSGGTVTYTALQLAYFMGFHQVVLIGVDHAFAECGTPNTVEIRTSEIDSSHFHPNYFPRGSRWQLPDLSRSEAAYELARRAFAANRREVLDATVGGQLEVFPKVDFEAVVER